MTLRHRLPKQPDFDDLGIENIKSVEQAREWLKRHMGRLEDWYRKMYDFFNSAGVEYDLYLPLAGGTITGNVTFSGTAGLHLRRLSQADIPAGGAGATQIETGELAIWVDSDNGNVYLVYNDADSGVVSVQLT